MSSEIEPFDDTSKAREAYAMHLAGADWSQVAESLGYSSADSARITVRKILQRAALQLSDEALEDMLGTELERLNALQVSVWPMAMAGDSKSIETVLKIMSTRHKLLGFEKRDEKVTNQTLVVGGDNFLEVLQKAVENRDNK